jgi:nitroreductase
MGACPGPYRIGYSLRALVKDAAASYLSQEGKMDTYKTILKRRSIRGFKQRRIGIKILKRMVNAARLAPSAANLQVLEFFIVTTKALRAQLFRHLKWAGYIAPAGQPGPGCEPVAYIVILVNMKKVSQPLIRAEERAARYFFAPDLRDIGAAAENIILTAGSRDIATCLLGAVNKHGIKRLLSIPRHIDVDSVIALGYPNTGSKTTRYKGSVRYFIDKKGVLNVPKRPLRDIMHINRLTR